MEAIWIAVRNFLVLLALSWIGVTAQPAKHEQTKEAEPAQVTSHSACSSGACESARPSFNTDQCSG